MQKHTVAIAFVRSAVAPLDEATRERLLTQSGIPPELLAVPGARVPARAFSNLWLAVARELDDEFFRLDSRRMKVGSFALLCSAMLACEDLHTALRRCLRAFRVLLDDISPALSVEQCKAYIRIDNRIAGAEQRRFAEETLLVMVHGLMCWLAGQRIPLLGAAFAYPRPAHGDEYKILFAHDLTFDAERTEVWFDARVLGAPVVQNRETLRRFLRSAPQSFFLKYKNEDSWTARLRKRLRRTEGTSWPTLEEMAAEFHIAPATLRRRLEAEGMTYQAIKDNLRRDIAIHYLSESDMSVCEIAEMLGFQDTSAFHRAFKRWTDSQPGEYRARRKAPAAAPASSVPTMPPRRRAVSLGAGPLP